MTAHRLGVFCLAMLSALFQGLPAIGADLSVSLPPIDVRHGPTPDSQVAYRFDVSFQYLKPAGAGPTDDGYLRTRLAITLLQEDFARFVRNEVQSKFSRTCLQRDALHYFVEVNAAAVDARPHPTSRRDGLLVGINGVAGNCASGGAGPFNAHNGIDLSVQAGKLDADDDWLDSDYVNDNDGARRAAIGGTIATTLRNTVAASLKFFIHHGHLGSGLLPTILTGQREHSSIYAMKEGNRIVVVYEADRIKDWQQYNLEIRHIRTIRPFFNLPLLPGTPIANPAYRPGGGGGGDSGRYPLSTSCISIESTPSNITHPPGYNVIVDFDIVNKCGQCADVFASLYHNGNYVIWQDFRGRLQQGEARKYSYETGGRVGVHEYRVREVYTCG